MKSSAGALFSRLFNQQGFFCIQSSSTNAFDVASQLSLMSAFSELRSINEGVSTRATGIIRV